MYWLGTVCNIFWKSLNVAISMGKLKRGCLGSTPIELSLFNISLLCKEFMEFFNMEKLKKMQHCIDCGEFMEYWNMGMHCGKICWIVFNQHDLGIHKKKFIHYRGRLRSELLLLWYIKNLPMPKLKRKLM